MTTAAEHILPARPEAGGRQAEGYFTPTADQTPQCAIILPKRVLPVVFLPGIMGSNLRISDPDRMRLLRREKEEDNKAWRPDDKYETVKSSRDTPAQRQLRLDPATTAVDIYDPNGPKNVSGDGRHDNVSLPKDFNSPLLMSDPPTAHPRRSAVQKARSRGWGEVYFSSYGGLLQLLETRLNHTFDPNGGLNEGWRGVVNADPAAWRADPQRPQEKLDEAQLKKVATGCWFPVHALGYNWLQDNWMSAQVLAERIDDLMNDYRKCGYTCEKVIVVTHSMGGLVGRALVHPDIGGMQDKVLGIVHGVLPAIGAPAAYKRMRAGFEDPGMLNSPTASIGAKVAGNYGDEVTAVLANSPGALQLLPSQAYGNGWLQVRHRDQTLEAWPKHGDPYEEIYKVRGKWYSLIREEWINPADLSERDGGGTIRQTHGYLDDAKSFHNKIAETYHPCTYVHYGDDPERASFSEVVWEISRNCADPSGWKEWPILADSRQGKLELVRWDSTSENNSVVASRSGVAMPTTISVFAPRSGAAVPAPITARILPPSGSGDETVPARSAQHQNAYAQAVFRQRGYEHQGSYKNRAALASTLYSIVRIAQTMTWSTQK